MPELRIGVSGWTYPDWRGGFYPAGLHHAEELAYLSRRINSVEINGSFYALQTPERYAHWRDETPPGFVFAVKGSRFITHMKKLRDPRPGLANFFASGPLALGDRLGPFLWQLPESLPFDASRMAGFLSALPTTTTRAAALAAECDRLVVPEPFTEVVAHRPLRHAIEPRHESYHDPAFAELLTEHGVSLVVADTAGRFPFFEEVTADFVYARLHGPHALYRGSYLPDLMSAWAERIRGWLDAGRDVYVYFDNTADGAAPRDAMTLAAALSA